MNSNFINSEVTPPIPFVRPLEPKMGMAVARRTVFRPEDAENWGNVATRVAAGNTGLVPGGDRDFVLLRNALAKMSSLLSGRHLQHGDANQGSRPMEVVTNCSTSATSFLLFALLLNGSGVGRDYSDGICLVDWDKAPGLVNVCGADHPDFDPGVYLTPEQASDMLAQESPAVDVTWYEVGDSREGWAKAAELYEVMAFEGRVNEVLVLDWSRVRPKGSPIKGMQNRPSSGPTPTAMAFHAIAHAVRGKGYPKWKQAMFVDHFLAECVVVGGARRSARMSTKYWGDEGAVEFARIKGEHGLWSSNNSIIATREFYEGLATKGSRAQQVFKAVTEASYFDGTGEPGIINVDNFAPNDIDWSLYTDGRYADSPLYHVEDETIPLMQALVVACRDHTYHFITNPCGEIQLFLLGGYCVIADTVPYFCDTLEEALDAFRLNTRALIRVNAGMQSIYDREVKRTNRIGVGWTGIFEFAWKFFGLGFRDLLDEYGVAAPFWQFMATAKRAVREEAVAYSTEFGLPAPATDTTVKPAGSTSKLAGLTEGAHLPSMREYLRWVQFRSEDPLVVAYKAKGYPTKELVTYAGTTVVGFPTQPLVCRLGMGDKLVTAPEATPEEQYRWLTLIEKYWLRGVDEAGEPLPVDTGNQVSYTLKYDPKKVTYKDFVRLMVKYQSRVKCCSVMPFADMSAYEYQPEEPFTSVGQFKAVLEAIDDPEAIEDIDLEHLACQTGACPL